jgi:Superinfection immunity protein
MDDHSSHPLFWLSALYFVPTLIAIVRRHSQAMAIGALNALLGWTVLGWIAAFVWSLTATDRNLEDV